MIDRLPTLTPRKIIQALQKCGYHIHRQSGSHVSLQHESGRLVIVPYHRRDVKRGTLHGILRQARLSDEEFLRLL